MAPLALAELGVTALAVAVVLAGVVYVSGLRLPGVGLSTAVHRIREAAHTARGYTAAQQQADELTEAFGGWIDRKGSSLCLDTKMETVVRYGDIPVHGFYLRFDCIETTWTPGEPTSDQTI